MRARVLTLISLVAAVGGLIAAGRAAANVSHAGWPSIDGVLLMNKLDQSAPLDARDSRGHNELLGGHGNDVIHAGPGGDVLWGDYKPTGNTTRQHDRLYGGRGDDFIYTSHGRNVVHAGGGVDVVHAYWGHGTIDCGKGEDIVYTRWNRPHAYRIRHCEHRSVNPTQSAPRWALKAMARHRHHRR